MSNTKTGVANHHERVADAPDATARAVLTGQWRSLPDLPPRMLLRDLCCVLRCKGSCAGASRVAPAQSLKNYPCALAWPTAPPRSTARAGGHDGPTDVTTEHFLSTFCAAYANRFPSNAGAGGDPQLIRM
jgi:hypothetical protein